MIPAIYITAVTLEFLFVIGALTYSILAIYSSFKGSAYVPTKNKETSFILKAAKLKKGQLFLDLGSGDGRLVREAVSKYKVRGIGIDINPLLTQYAKVVTKLKKIKGAEFLTKNVFDTDLKKADVVYIFLMPKLIAKLETKLKKETKKGALILSHGFKIPGLEKYKIKTIKHEPFPTYFYKR